MLLNAHVSLWSVAASTIRNGLLVLLHPLLFPAVVWACHRQGKSATTAITTKRKHQHPKLSTDNDTGVVFATAVLRYVLT